MEERLQKVIARAGIASRREAEKLIEDGRVQVNGKVVRELGIKVNPELDEVRVDTVPIHRKAATGDGKRTYLLLNKPKGVICTVKDTHGRPTVIDLVPPFRGKRLYPVGRLDEDSEGLVLLTNDGELTAKLTHPRYGVPKSYDIRVRGKLTIEDVRKFEQGVWLSDGKTGRSRATLKRTGPKVSHCMVTLTEGRNRELRRAFAKLGFNVLSIRRIQFGPLVGRSLKLGQFRPLDDEELQALRDATEGRGTGAPLRRSPSRRPTQRPAHRPGKPDPRKRDTKKATSRKTASRKGGPKRAGPGKAEPRSGRSGARSGKADARSSKSRGGPKSRTSRTSTSKPRTSGGRKAPGGAKKSSAKNPSRGKRHK